MADHGSADLLRFLGGDQEKGARRRMVQEQERTRLVQKISSCPQGSLSGGDRQKYVPFHQASTTRYFEIDRVHCLKSRLYTLWP
jgi:hypothetical protein